MPPDPSTPISDEAVEAVRATLRSEWRFEDKPDEVWIPAEEIDRAITAALEAAAPFMASENERRRNAASDGWYLERRRAGAAEAKAATLAAQIEAVRALHQPRDEPNSVTGELGCRMCWLQWPCPTIQALGSTETREGNSVTDPSPDTAAPTERNQK